uniref:Uncharacterized protein n=1 Tax=Magallana gigas TaxID=29159 RepID=K1Q4T1_MAGGI
MGQWEKNWKRKSVEKREWVKEIWVRDRKRRKGVWEGEIVVIKSEGGGVGRESGKRKKECAG